MTVHFVRSIPYLNQWIFALNEQYCLNEKKAVRMIDTFSIRPEGYKQSVDRIFALAGTDPAFTCSLLEGLVREVKNLA